MIYDILSPRESETIWPCRPENTVSIDNISYELENFLVLAETTRDGVLVNQDGVHVFANKSLVRMLGYANVETILGTKMDFVLHSSVMEEVKERFARRSKGEAVPSQYETVFAKSDGSPLPVELNATMTRWNGRIAGMVSVRDISVRRALEQELEDSRIQLQLLVEDRTNQLYQKEREAQDLLAAMPDLMFIVDDSGNILNYQAPQDVELQLADFVGKNLINVFPAEFTNEGLRLIQAVVQSRDMQFLEYKMCNSEGVLCDYEARFMPFCIDQVIVLIRDISKRKRTEQRLVESRHQMKTILDSLTQVVWAVRLPDYEPLYCSQSFRTVYGREISAWEQDGRIWEKVVHPEDADIISKIYHELAKQRYTSNEYRILHPDGSTVWVLSQIRQVDELGGSQALIGSLKDITDRKTSELRLLEASRKAEAASQAKTEFLSRMSHELRTPMNAILGFGQLLQMDNARLSLEHQDTVQHILDGGQHLLGLINEILDISKVDAGRIDLTLENIDLFAICNRSIELIRNLAVKQNIEIISAFSQEKLLVKADQKRLTQVIVNLLSNAIKYNRPNGSIRLYCKNTHSNGVEMARILIKDSGVGISEKDHSKIFEPFVRLNTRNISDVEGTGIGLSITKKFVELMHGNIGFESEVGKGSTFWFELPFASINEMNKTQSPQKILYIEDNPVNRQLVAKLVARHSDYHLEVAANAELGIKMALESIPNLILMDIGLPGMDGIEALQYFRNNSITAHIPIIAVSAHAMPEVVENGKQAGFQDYITKPVDIKRLLTSIDRFLLKETCV